MSLTAFDARKYNDFGIGTYIRSLITEYAAMKVSRPFLIYFSPEDSRTVTLPAGWESAVAPYGKYSIGEVFQFGRQINKRNVSVFHSPHYTLPIGLKGRSVVTIHDLIHLKFPQIFSILQRSYSFGMIWHAIHDSRFVITDSEFTKRDILQSFRVPEEKIIPIHLGVSEEFHREISHQQVGDFRAKYHLERPYILFVGNTKPHKGLSVLLQSFNETRSLFPDIELVIVGGTLDGDAGVQKLIQSASLSERVRILGRLSHEELILAYKGAEMFVLPSLYEGFGLPALEAMACGVPVIVSDAGSLPEVVGNAAIICKSGDHGMFGEAMIYLLRDPALRTSMVERGKSRSKLFSWRETARKTLKVYQEIS